MMEIDVGAIVIIFLCWAFTLVLTYQCGRMAGWSARDKYKGHIPPLPLPPLASDDVCRFADHFTLVGKEMVCDHRGGMLHCAGNNCERCPFRYKGRPMPFVDPVEEARDAKERMRAAGLLPKAFGEKPPRDTGHVGTPMDRIPLRGKLAAGSICVINCTSDGKPLENRCAFADGARADTCEDCPRNSAAYKNGKALRGNTHETPFARKRRAAKPKGKA